MASETEDSSIPAPSGAIVRALKEQIRLRAPETGDVIIYDGEVFRFDGGWKPTSGVFTKRNAD